MISIYATIEAYDSASDTCTVELTEIGAIDTWISGIRLQANLNRAYASAGTPCIVQMPDMHRICEATVVALYPPGAIVQGTPSGATMTQTGRAILFTDIAGHAATAIAFPQPFGSPPQVSVTGDNGVPFLVSGVSQTQFQATLNHPYQPNAYVGFTWSASG